MELKAKQKEVVQLEVDRRKELAALGRSVYELEKQWKEIKKM